MNGTLLFPGIKDLEKHAFVGCPTSAAASAPVALCYAGWFGAERAVQMQRARPPRA